jgi:diguanylate cyclase (GGDEF)-like protein
LFLTPGELTLAGPFNLIRGGMGAAARLPIYLETARGESFWGFSAVLIRFPEVLTSANLPSLAEAGYAYELSRIHPDTHDIHIIASSTAPLIADPESFYIDVPNVQWTFSITPVTTWTALTPLIIKCLFGLLFTLLSSFLALLLVRLKNEHAELESLVVERTKELASLAHYDVLTQLPNRALFADRFKQAVAQCQRTHKMLAICFLDLDDFKVVNDTFGHGEGDKLLVAVAARLKKNIRNVDTVSLQGGDEFILLLNEIPSIEQLELTLERIRHAMIKSYLIEGRIHNINLSFGATVYPRDNADLDTLLRHPDHAMYQAKLTGKNRYYLFDNINDDLVAQQHNDLQEVRQALINNEFQLYYQPKVNMKMGELFGAEALIRWIHPDNGLIPPLDFLPLVESSEVEIDIGGWVINQAVKQLNTWFKQDIDLELSINISSHHLQSPLFLVQLKTALSRYPAVRPHNLQLEILESSALGDISTTHDLIKQCQTELGLSIALDDFGTGYSSLTHLRNLPANTIKIDQTFVRDLLDDPNDFSIIDGVISLAEAFDREIIAEGVETTEHGLMLMVMGCDSAQGYGIARPLPAHDFTLWLDAYQPNQTWLDYGQTTHSAQEQKLTLITLTTAHWFEHLSQQLESNDPSVIETFKACHLGTWLNRFEQDALFDSAWLDLLRQAHDNLFDYAKSLSQHAESGCSEQEVEHLAAHYQTLAGLIENYQRSSLLSLFSD